MADKARKQDRKPAPVGVCAPQETPEPDAATARAAPAPAGAAPHPGRAGQSFWDAVRRPRFRDRQTRLLLVTSGYFLQREIAQAALRLGWLVRELPVPPGGRGCTAFVESLLAAVLEFGPDLALTVNHLGLDTKGELLGLFERMALPLASWFVDSPRLILHDFPGQRNPFCAAFTWDADTVDPLKEAGFELVRWLPLATDTTLFRPDPASSPAASEAMAVSFVGDSMLRPIARLKDRLARHPGALRLALEAAPRYAQAPEREALAFMAAREPDLHAAWQALPRGQLRLDLEQLVTWEATRLFRLERVGRLLPFAPVVAGDPGWLTELPATGWSPHPPLDYYRDLPAFYAASRVNFNATSLQMKGAVNQRVFDVPACGAFLLTDRRQQMEALFEPGRECVVYENPEEIPEMVSRALSRPEERQAVAQAARQRVLAGHDYTHRLRELLKAMRRRYA